jgi:hypothetical protein
MKQMPRTAGAAGLSKGLQQGPLKAIDPAGSERGPFAHLG